LTFEKTFGLESFKLGPTSSTKDERKPDEVIADNKVMNESIGFYFCFIFELKESPETASVSSKTKTLKIEDPESTTDHLNLPEIFNKYMLTTDIPFKGVRTSVVSIQPQKSPVSVLTKENESPVVHSTSRIGHSHRSKTVTLNTLQSIFLSKMNK
jgi:hypothetical protein